MILFVASNPSHLNHDPDVAMTGSKSDKTFTEWRKFLAPEALFKVVNVANVVTENNRPLKRSEFDLLTLANHALDPSVTKIVALGNTASEALEELGLKFFKLPHPSPLNRFLNNKEQVEAVLEECKQWLQ